MGIRGGFGPGGAGPSVFCVGTTLPGPPPSSPGPGVAVGVVGAQQVPCRPASLSPHPAPIPPCSCGPGRSGIPDCTPTPSPGGFVRNIRSCHLSLWRQVLSRQDGAPYLRSTLPGAPRASVTYSGHPRPGGHASPAFLRPLAHSGPPCRRQGSPRLGGQGGCRVGHSSSARLGGQGRRFRPPPLPRRLLGTPDRGFCARSAREARASAAGEPLLCSHPP